MSPLSAQGPRPTNASAANALAQLDSRGAAVPASLEGGRAPARNAVVGPVALSDGGIDLSKRLAQRNAQLGNSTVDVAQDFLNSFARQYLGKAGNGASLSFDSASLS